MERHCVIDAFEHCNSCLFLRVVIVNGPAPSTHSSTGMPHVWKNVA